MPIQVKLSSNDDLLPLRTSYRDEMNCQIVHDSIHRRSGWTSTYVIELAGVPIGFGSVAIAGPWKDKPTVFEFYLLPQCRSRAFELFEQFLSVSRPGFLEVQSNDNLCATLAITYGRELATEKIVFHDRLTSTLTFPGATLRLTTPEVELRSSLERRQGGGEWILELDGSPVAKGGILFHYNRPYGDIYMEVDDAYRQRGVGSYLVQELKRLCYALGAIPGARCDPTNVASRRTLQRAGFVPFAHILIGMIARA